MHSSSYGNSIVKSNATDFLLLRHQLAEAFPYLRAVERTRFMIRAPFLELITRGEKTTTIRYQADIIEYPSAHVLPVVAIDANSSTPSVNTIFVRINCICYKKFCQLDTEDARRDGFSSLPELQHALQEFYGVLNANEVMTIFSITPEEGFSPAGSQSTHELDDASILEREANIN